MSADRYDCVGPDMGTSTEEQEREEQTDELVDILNDLPTLSDEEVADRHAPRMNSVFSDERSAAMWRDKYRPPQHDLPGFGEEYDTCGWQIPHVCEEHGHQHNIGRTCSRSVCPRCAPAWVAKRAVPITARIESAAKMMGEPGEAVYKHHAVASPPPEMLLDSDDWYESCMDALKEWMEEIEMQGIILPHPYSGKNEDDEFGAAHDDDIGEWKKRLFADRDWEGDVRHELQHRPHFHIIGATTWFPGAGQTDRIYEETKPDATSEHGWVFHRITGNRGRSSISLGEIDEVARAVTYALSHCAIDTDGDGNNRYLHQKTGWAYHAAEGEHHEANVRRAREAVHKTIGDTLGIDWTQVGCHEKVHEDEQDHDHVEASSGDGDGEEESTPDDTNDKMRSCHGGLTNIHDADFIDEDWAADAVHGDQALSLKQRWEESGGWNGWVERGGELPPPGSG